MWKFLKKLFSGEDSQTGLNLRDSVQPAGPISKGEEQNVITVRGIPLPESESDFPLQIVGESRYQAVLESICGGRTKEGANYVDTAFLYCEDNNPYDKSAVRVDIMDKTVGYLAKEDAKAYRAFLESQGHAGSIGVCKAQVRGGWKRRGSQGHFGVWLNFVLYG